MAKFRNIAVISQIESNNEDNKFSMANDYGGQLRNQQTKVQDIQEVEETLYGEENSQFSNNLPDANEGLQENNARRNINFDPTQINHRK